MPGIQQLIFDVIARDSASPAFAKLAATTKDAGGNVSELSRKITELGQKSASARVSLSGDKEAQASLDRLDAKLLTLTHRQVTTSVSIEGAARAGAELAALDLELDKIGKQGGSAATAQSAFSSLSGMGGMGALIAAGVVLSPVIVTLGTGLAGLAVAAYGVIKPIEQAAQKTGGLQANLKNLDPQERAVAQSLHGLGLEYDAFQKALKPELLGIFNTGLKIAGNLMHDVEPVAAATGKAFNTFLGQFGATLQDPNWRQFWAFMAATAPQDMHLLGNLIIDLTNDLPPLLEGLQPAATLLLRVADGAAKAAGVLALLMPAAEGTARSTTKLGLALNLAALGFQFTAPPAALAIGLFDKLGGATERAATGGAAAARSMSIFLGGAAGALKDLGAQSVVVTEAQWHLMQQEGKSADSMQTAAKRAQLLSQMLQSAATQTTALMTAQQNALSVQVGYGTSLVTTANDAQNLRDKLYASGGQVGLQTQKQRDSFAAANTYITDLGNTAVAAFKSGHGVDAAITAIRNGLPILDSAKTRNRQYWQEVATLVGWLDKLRAEKAISEAIHVSGTGVWTVTPGKIGLPGGTAGGPFAAGGRITAGTTPTADDVLIRASRNETVLSAAHSAMLAPLLRQIGVPGYAGGGVIGSYAGNVAGLGPWSRDELNLSANAVVQSTAAALIAGIRTATATAVSGIGGGVRQWAPVVSKVLAMLESPVLPGDLGIVLSQIATESGGNPFAVNRWDSNWLAGHPSVGILQVIAGTYAMNAAGLYGYPPPVAYGVSENPEANIYAGLHYAMSRYGPGWRGVLGHGHGYDQGGPITEPILGVGASGTRYSFHAGESVLGSRAEALLEQAVGLLDELCSLQAQNNGIAASAPAVTGAALGMGARAAAYRQLYP